MTFPLPASTLARNPFEVARSHLIRRLLEITPPKAMHIASKATDFEAVAEHIKQASEMFDDWLAAIGAEVADNSPFNVDGRDFDRRFGNAAEDAVFGCEQIAERLGEDRRVA